MSNNVSIGTLEQFPVGSLNHIEVDGIEIAMVHCEEGLFAVSDICSHAEVSLSDGYLNGCKLECPMHGAEFDVKTGEALSLPATKAIDTYKVTINGEGAQASVSLEIGK
ncbi:MAG: hypothetical protein RLZZ330_1181 [Actinomycetota bacterium]|jgi:3-phenylpropionate/trans-cinnamate dioxygenase ferredoxin subunit